MTWRDDLIPRVAPSHGYRNGKRSGGVSNPRYANGNARRKIRERWKAIGAPCAICGKPIDYDLGYVKDTGTGKRKPHPMMFTVDEIVPVSLGGSPFDFANTRPAHWICNVRRGNGTNKKPTSRPLPLPFDDAPC